MSHSLQHLSGLGLSAFLLFLPLGATWGQAPETPPPAGSNGDGSPTPAAIARVTDLPPFSPALFLPTDPDLPRKLDALPDLVREKEWARVTRFLQGLLDNAEDAFVPLRQHGADDHDAVQWVSAWGEANRLLSTLPAQGLEFYELSYGSEARTLLQEARQHKDVRLLAEVARRYQHTRAGTEALDRLGTLHLDRGRYLLAALCYERLLGQAGADQLSPLTLFKAAQAFQSAGESESAEAAWKRLATAAPDGLRLGDRTASLEDLRREVTARALRSGDGTAPVDWMMFGGGPARCVRAAGDAPLLEARWQQATSGNGAVRDWLQDALRRQEVLSQPLLPSSFPLLVGDRFIYRSQRGIEAFDAGQGRPAWRADAVWGLDSMAGQGQENDLAHVSGWVSSYLEDHPQVLSANSVLGMLSTDGSRVYAVDDLPMPPFPRCYSAFAAHGGQCLRLSFAPELTTAIGHNELLAIDLESGKVAWDLGGELDNNYFLGPPLPLRGRLYALTEKEQELRLLCLEPATGEIIWTQTLGIVRNPMVLDGGRRLHAAPLACSDGVLVCPTNAGAVFGVDLISHQLLWAHSYREVTPPPVEEAPRGRFRPGLRPMLPQGPPNLTSSWTACAPMVQDGKVVFTAPDAPVLQCLSLRDGSLLWEARQQPESLRDALYLAGVVQGKVIVVGRASCQALALEDGKPLWRVETGLPCGHGAFAGAHYYLPVKTSGERGPGVLVIDMDEGVVRRHVAAPRQALLGNLLFHNGQVFSQTSMAVAAFPQTGDRSGGEK